MEENIHLQTRSALAVARFIDFCAIHSLAQPPGKIVKNLSTFLCQDVERTPTFAHHRKTTDGVLSFTSAHKAQENGGTATSAAEEVRLDKSRISRRGARLAFEQLSARFRSQLPPTCSFALFHPKPAMSAIAFRRLFSQAPCHVARRATPSLRRSMATETTHAVKKSSDMPWMVRVPFSPSFSSLFNLTLA